MNSLLDVSPEQFRRAADLQEQIKSLQAMLGHLLGQPQPEPPQPAGPVRRLSAQDLANIRAGVAKRMAAKSGLQHKAPKRMSAAAKARLSAIATARWKKAKAAGKNAL